MPKASRSLQACQECRKRKTRCDGARPRCDVCSRKHKPCYWSEDLAPGGYRVTFSTASPGVEKDASRLDQTGNGTYSQAEAPIGDSDLPPLPLQQRLLHIFSQTHLGLELCGCVYMDPLRDGTCTNQSRLLLFSIMALSAIYLTDAEAKSDPRFATSESLMSYYKSKAQAESRQSSDLSTIVTIQGNLVLGLCELLTMATSKAWLHIGLAIRMAQALRMRNEYNRRHIPRQREIRRRTFWSCVMLDRLVAYCTFRTQTIDLTLVGLHLPCSDVAFAFGQDSTGPKLDELGVIAGTSSGMMTLPYFVKTFMLWSPIARSYVERGRRKLLTSRHGPTSSYWENETAMKTWRDSLPTEMIWSETNLRAHQSLGQITHFTSIHFLIQHALFLVDHEYLPHIRETGWPDGNILAPRSKNAATLFDDADPAAIRVCLDEAYRVVSMLRLIDTATTEIRQCPLGTCVGMPIVTAASVLLWVYHCSQKAVLTMQLSESEIFQARSDVDYLLSILDSWAKIWALARAWTNCIKLLDEFYQSIYRHDFEESTVSTAQAKERSLAADQRSSMESRAATPTHLRDGDGLPDVTMIPHGTYYKVRLITGLVFEQPEICKKFLHMAGQQPTEAVEQQVDPWEVDLDFSWMNDPDIVAASSLWTDFMLPADD